MADIEAALSDHKQELAFEPCDLGALLGGGDARATLAGVMACNLAGPRRIKAGAARDHFLGFTAVSGRGEIFKSGGRVVKNVTGYDLCKLMAGSYGTLAALTEVTVKVLPASEKTRTVLVFGLDDRTAVQAMTRALNSAHEVSAAAHLPADLARASAVSYLAGAGTAATAIRVEGPGPSVEHRCAALRRELADLGETEELHGHNSRRLWREVRDVQPLAGRPDLDVWRLSIPPSEAAGVLEELRLGGPVTHFLDWGGGLLWVGLPSDDEASIARVRGTLESRGGHATLIRAAEALRGSAPVFQPQDPATAALSQRIKESFDPRRVLNPGRMYAGV